ncbi:MAG: glycoside hydrolase family 76 protein [Saccharofermentanales bacterium]
MDNISNTGIAVSLSRKADTLYKRVKVLFDNYGQGILSEHYPIGENDHAVAYLWPMSAMHSAVVALHKMDRENGDYIEYIDTIEDMLEKYRDDKRKPPAYQALPEAYGGAERFYDDNEWIGLDFLERYEQTHHAIYLDKAIIVSDFIKSGMSDELNGGIYWCEQTKDMKNTCSNAPAALFYLKLFKLTGDHSFYTLGLELYKWTKMTLQDTDGLYMDHVKKDGSIDKTKYTYNSGVMIQAAVELFLITSEKQYLEDAQRIARSSMEYFAPSRGSGNRFYPAGTPWFNAVLFRGIIALVEIDDNYVYFDLFIENIMHAWEYGMDKNGLIDRDWSGETSNNSKWLLDQAAMIEIYAQAAIVKNNQGEQG